MESYRLDNDNELTSLNEQTFSSCGVALLRIKFLQDNGEGFASCFYSWLEAAIVDWSENESQRRHSNTELVQNSLAVQSLQEVSLLTFQEQTADEATIYTRTVDCSGPTDSREGRWLCHLLRLHVRVLQLDPVLGEELGRQGTHSLLSRLLLDIDQDDEESDEENDTTCEIRELACEVAARSGGAFPLRVSPFGREELLQRLPLVFAIQPVRQVEADATCPNRSEAQTVLLHQVTIRQSAQEDVGFGTFVASIIMLRYVSPVCVLL